MIIKIHKPGRSFKGVCRYLIHDAKAESAERVAWTKTFNLANDDVNSAVDEMLWTFRSADMLKRQAGAATGGSKLDKPVRHISLSWPHGEAPSQEHMAETVQAYLRFMGWADRQAVVVAHNDTKHAHVHVVLNSVSPADGRALKSSHDYRRSEDFALRYEREHGQIHCDQRLKDRKTREATPTREAWQRFKKAEGKFDRDEAARVVKQPGYFERHDKKGMDAREWEALKGFQREQRERFFIDGKEAFREVRSQAFREIRQEFRPQWNAFYAAKRNGHDRSALAEMKIALVAAQNRALDEQRDRASDTLRKMRDEAYKKVLEQQKVDRDELGLRQLQGLRTYAIMDVIYPAPAPAPAKEAERPPTGWTIGVAKSENDRAANRIIQRAGSTTVDPDSIAKDERLKPHIFARQVGGEDPPRAKAPTKEAPPASQERTEAAVEKERASKTRELRDGQVEKDQREETFAARASWNKTRGSRGRRD